MKITKKAFADILEKRLVDRIIFAHLEPGFYGIKLVRRQSRHTNFSVQLFAPFHSAKIRTLSGCNPLRRKLKKIDIEFSLNR